MRSDLEYYYVADLSPEVKVNANIEAVELRYKERNHHWNDTFKLMMTPADAREVATMLLKAADHVEDLNKKEPK